MLFAVSGGGRESAGTVATVLLFLFLLQRLLTPVSAITFARNAILLHIDAIFDYEVWVERARAGLQKDGHIPFHELREGIRFEVGHVRVRDRVRERAQGAFVLRPEAR